MYAEALRVYSRFLDQRREVLWMDKNGAVPDSAARLAWLRTEHRDLDSAIDALEREVAADQLQLARLKKRKLRLKDEIARLEDVMIPDIIA